MIDFTIKVENKNVGDAVVLFFDNYKDHIAQFLNNVLKNEVGQSDAFIDRDESGVFQVWQSAPDKGHVLAQVEGAVTLAEYKTLPTETKYVVFDGQRLALFLKEPEGQPDVKVGNFLNINEVVSQIDSDSVKDAIQQVRNNQKNAAVVEKQIAKKVKKLAAAAGK